MIPSLPQNKNPLTSTTSVAAELKYPYSQQRISNIRYVRVFGKDGKLLTVTTIYGYEIAALNHLENQGLINLWTRHGSFVAKPRNILHVPTPHSHDDMTNLVLNLPITVDLRTVNLTDYPEYFV